MLCFTQHGISGIFAIIAMLVVAISMSSYSKRFKNVTFDKRFWLHWTFTVLAVALCFHSKFTLVNMCSPCSSIDQAYV